MRIAVLSDTHMNSPNQALITACEQIIKDMDAVLHCGDITGEQVYAFLNAQARLYAVAGNMDMGQWADSLPRKTVVRLGEFRIGLVHGYGLGSGRLDQNVVSAFNGQEVDLACFGHTHRRLFDAESFRVPVLNPGSFSLPKGSPPGFACLSLLPGRQPEVEWIDL